MSDHGQEYQKQNNPYNDEYGIRPQKMLQVNLIRDRHADDPVSIHLGQIAIVATFRLRMPDGPARTVFPALEEFRPFAVVGRQIGFIGIIQDTPLF